MAIANIILKGENYRAVFLTTMSLNCRKHVASEIMGYIKYTYLFLASYLLHKERMRMTAPEMFSLKATQVWGSIFVLSYVLFIISMLMIVY